MLGVMPSRPWALGRIPGTPGGLGLGALGADPKTIGKALSELCSSTEHHTKCEGGRTVSKPCTAVRNCATHKLVSTDCWNDQVCSSGGGGDGGGGGGGGSSAPSGSGAPDSSWTKCADQWGWCDWPGSGIADVKYGSDTRWVEKDSATDKLECRVSSFGKDPSPGNLGKACYYKVVGSPAPPPVTNVPVPPATGSAPPTPLQQCDAPSFPALDYTQRWVEVDPVQCLWQIVRTSKPGQPEVLPNVYGGEASIIIPQSAVPGQTPLSPGAVGLYQPSYQTGGGGGGGLVMSSSEILQAYLDVLGRGPTPEELTEAEGKQFANIAELYAWLREEGGGTIDDVGGGVAAGFGASSWVSDHPYLTLGAAAAGLWLLFGRRR